jgi:hypothetical protein
MTRLQLLPKFGEELLDATRFNVAAGVGVDPAVRAPRLRLTRDQATTSVAGSQTRFHRSQNLRSASAGGSRQPSAAAFEATAHFRIHEVAELSTTAGRRRRHCWFRRQAATPPPWPL